MCSSDLAAPDEAVVLSSFEMRQTGENIELIDADGSVYVGNLQAPAAAPAPSFAVTTPDLATRADNYGGQDGRKNANTAPIRAAKNNANPLVIRADNNGAFDNKSLALDFKAVGTNRSLNKRVEIRGTLTEADNNASQGALEKPQEIQQKQITPPLSNRALPSDPAATGQQGYANAANSNLGAARSQQTQLNGPNLDNTGFANGYLNFNSYQRVQGAVKIGNGTNRQINAVRDEK